MIMKIWLLLAVVVFALVAAGIVHFQRDGDHLNISIDEARLKNTSQKLIHKGEEFLEDARDTVDSQSSRISERDRQWESEARSRAQRFRSSESQR
jgi:hypothetical protein